MRLAVELAAAAIASRALWSVVEGSLTRVGNEFALHWLESVNYGACLRRLQGGFIYSPPGPAWTGLMYGPVFPELCGISETLFGPGFGPARAVAILGTVCAMAGIFVAARTANSGLSMAFSSAVLFLVYCTRVRYWHDMVQVDTTFIAFAVWAVLLLARDPPTRRRACIAGVLAAAACMTKQVGLPLALAVGCYLLLAARRVLPAYLAGLASAVPVGTFLLLKSDGWAWTYLVSQPLGTGFRPDKLAIGPVVTYARVSLGAVLSVLAVGALAFTVQSGRHRLALWFVASCALGVSGYSAYCKVGASANSLLPFLAVSTVCIGIVPGALLGAEPARAALAAVVAGMLLTLPIPSPPSLRPTHVFEATLERVVARLPGKVLMPGRPEVLARSGRPPCFHHSSLKGLVGYTPIIPFPSPIRSALRRQEWRAAVVWRGLIEKEVQDAGYHLTKELGRDPLIGVPVRVYEPRPVSAATDR